MNKANAAEPKPIAGRKVLVRSILAGISNTIAGPLIFLALDFLIFRNVLYSFLTTEVIMLLYKMTIYRIYVFRGHKKRVGLLMALLVTAWGLSTNTVLQSMALSQAQRRLFSLAFGVSGSAVIVIGAVVISRWLVKKS